MSSTGPSSWGPAETIGAGVRARPAAAAAVAVQVVAGGGRGVAEVAAARGPSRPSFAGWTLTACGRSMAVSISASAEAEREGVSTESPRRTTNPRHTTATSSQVREIRDRTMHVGGPPVRRAPARNRCRARNTRRRWQGGQPRKTETEGVSEYLTESSMGNAKGARQGIYERMKSAYLPSPSRP